MSNIVNGHAIITSRKESVKKLTSANTSKNNTNSFEDICCPSLEKEFCKPWDPVALINRHVNNVNNQQFRPASIFNNCTFNFGSNMPTGSTDVAPLPNRKRIRVIDDSSDDEN